MKLISFVAIKGGVGKTTLALLTGQYLAQKGNKVLFIDLDHQSNLTHFYDVYKDQKTVANILQVQMMFLSCLSLRTLT